MNQFFTLFLGSPSAHEDAAVSSAAPALRVRLMGIFNKSLTAANRFPATLQASTPINACLAHCARNPYVLRVFRVYASEFWP